MATMLLKMTISTCLYLIITAIVWHFWSKSKRGPLQKIAVGLVFGFCSVMSTHLGVDYRNMILNVRDLGPLIAGLFFAPSSGIIAGLIGGVERYIAGTYFDVGSFTTVSCSLSTLLAGLMSAVLNVFMFKGKRPPAFHAAVIGMVMEVFHMYAVLLTHRNDMASAHFIVKSCSVPMIVFCGLGLTACSILIMILYGEKYEYIPFSDRERTPIAKRFYRQLLAATLLVFVINHLMDYNLQTRAQFEQAEEDLNNMATGFRAVYFDTKGDMEKARILNSYISLAGGDDIYYLIYDDNGNVLSSLYSEENEMFRLSESERQALAARPEWTSFRHTVEFYGGMDAVCVKRALNEENTVFVLLAWQYDMLMRGQINQAYEVLLSDGRRTGGDSGVQESEVGHRLFAEDHSRRPQRSGQCERLFGVLYFVR